MTNELVQKSPNSHKEWGIFVYPAICLDDCNISGHFGICLPGVGAEFLFAKVFTVEALEIIISTKLSFDVKLDSERVKETTKTISKVLRVVKETIRSYVRKKK